MAATRWIPISLLLVAVTSCGSGSKSGPAMDDRLNGEWDLVLTIAPIPLGREAHDTGGVRGTLALVSNTAGTEVPGFGRVPQQVGAHNLRLDRLVPSLNERHEVPTAAGACIGDSVYLILDPGSAAPMMLRGRWKGAGVAGEWIAHRRAGIDQGGGFTLRRSPP